jgi:hypothetical protein
MAAPKFVRLLNRFSMHPNCTVAASELGYTDECRRGRAVPGIEGHILPTRKTYKFIALVLATAASAASSIAQDKPDAPPAKQSDAPFMQSSSTEKAQASDKSDKGNEAQGKEPQDVATGTSKDRLFFTLPNFLTLENANQVPPLTAGQKYKVVVRSSFDYVQYPWYGFLAGISQAENSEPGYGQGAGGYGKRYGAALADGTIENFLTSAVLPSLLRQDPRFFQSGKGGFWHRTGYAMSRVMITRGDSGHSQVNYSEIFGSAISAGISTYSYHPRADRNVRNAGSVWGTQVGYDTLTYVVKEFWPDIRRKLRKK